MNQSNQQLNQEIQVIINGRVQGVGFRWFVQETAQNLKIKGFVQNKSNGSVEALCQGDKKSLQELIKKIHIGPSLSKVSKVEVDWVEPTQQYHSFSIKV